MSGEPRIAVIGDVHFRSREYKEGEDYITVCVDAVKQLRPTHIVVLGDILDTHEVVRIAPFMQACKFIEQLSCIAPTYQIIGNHDMINGSQFLSNLHAFNPLKRWPNVTIVDDVVHANFGKRQVTLCPYVPPGRFVEALDTKGDTYQTSDVIFAHQEFFGCAMGGITSEIGDVWPDEYPIVVSGHIHEEQRVGNNVYYTGSSRQVAFGDENEKGIWLITFPFTLEKHVMPLRGKKTIRKEIRDLTAATKVSDVLNEDDLQRFSIKLQLLGTAEQIKAFRKGALHKALYVYDQVNLRVSYVVTCETGYDAVVDAVTAAKYVTYEEVMAELVGASDPSVQELYRELTALM